MNPVKEQLSTVSRRRFLEAASLAALGTSVASADPVSWPSDSAKPNILMIISDEHRGDMAGCYGNRIVRTPHMDELASQGVIFDNCYTNSPLCAPSRLSFISGKYSSHVGVWNNECWLPNNDYPSIARLLQHQGYETFLCGKMHFDRTRNYGFTEIGPGNDSFKGGKGARLPFDNTKIDIDVWKKRAALFHTADSSRILDFDRKVVEIATQFLASRPKDAKPFFLIVGLLAPHFPLTVPKAYYSHYQGRIEPPRLPVGHVEMQSLNYQQLRHGFGIVKTDPSVVLKGRECYYGLTEWCDNNIGAVLSSLRKSPSSENTAIIYTTDHGENMGDHGLWWKNCMYNTACRIPLIVSWPQRWRQGQRRAGVCSLVDLSQTILSLAGVVPPEDWDGDSLIPLLDDEHHAWKDMAVSEYYAHFISSGFVMIRRGNYKYVYHTQPNPRFPSQRELYDLNRDPEEFVNLCSIPERQGLIAELHALLVKELGEDPENTERRCRKEIAIGYNR